MPPLISVLLPVRNGATFREEFLSSILSQTFKDFECILVNDGSTAVTVGNLRRIESRRGRTCVA